MADETIKWPEQFELKENPDYNDFLMGQDVSTGSPVKFTMESIQAAAGNNVIGAASPTDSPSGTETDGESYRVSNDTASDVTYTNFLDSTSTAVVVPANSSGYLTKNADGWVFVKDVLNTSNLVPKTAIIDNLDSTSADEVLSANQGKILNDTKLDKTAYGDTGDFNGTTSEVLITPDFILENENDAIEFRVKIVNKTIDNHGVFGTKGIGGSNFIGFNSGGSVMGIRTSEGTLTSLNLPAGIDITLFHKYKLVKTSTGYSLYVDGNLSYSAANTNTIVVNNIGQAYGAVFVTMQMSDVVFYKAGVIDRSLANPAIAQSGFAPVDVNSVATKTNQQINELNGSISAMQTNITNQNKVLASSSKNWLSIFTNSPASSLDFDKTYSLNEIGDAIEFEVRLLDTLGSFGIVGTKGVAANNWIGVDSDNRVRFRDASGNTVTSGYIKSSDLCKIRLEVVDTGWKVVYNDVSRLLHTKTDGIDFNNIGRAYSNTTNGNFELRNFKYYQAGVLKIDLQEAFSGVNTDGTQYTISNVGKREPGKKDVILPFVGITSFFWYGQSLSIGTDVTGSLAISKPLYSNLTWTGGVRAGTALVNGDITSLKSLEESVDNGNLAETPISSTLNYFTRLAITQIDNTFYRLFGATNGVGGMSLVSLSNGGQYFEDLKNTITAFYGVESLEFKTFLAIIWIQGEADYTSTSGSTTYGPRLKTEILDPLQAHVESVAGITHLIKMFTYQLASHLYYAWASEWGSTDRPAARVPYIALQQKKAADTYPDRIVNVVPMYIFDYITPKNLHMHGTEYAHMGAYFGKAMYRVFMEGFDWKGLKPISVKKLSDNKSINIQFNVENGLRLEWDDVANGGLVTAIQDKGFEVYDSTGRLAISSVEIISNDTVRITLLAPISGTAPYVAYGFGSDITDIQVGRTTGPRGQLRDNDGDFYQCTNQDGLTHKLHNFCLIFQENIV